MGALSRGFFGAVMVAVLWVAGVTGVAAQDGGRKVALVIGNSVYASVGILPNPVNDAGAVAESFTRIGFEVTYLQNLDFSGMRSALQEFERAVIGSEIAAVFYAGHGIEMGGQNYLIPVDARLQRDTHVVDEAVPLSRVLSAVQAASKLRIVLLDACRNNPFASQMQTTGATRAVSRGFVRVEPPGGGTLIAYAAKEGTTADDGDTAHSPFTTALLDSLEQPGLEVRLLFGRVRDDVMSITGGIQEPFVYNSLGGTPIYLIPAAAVEPPPVNAIVPVPGVTVDNVAAAYTAAQAINTIEAWAAFLRYHDNGFYADLARAAMAKLDPVGIVGPGNLALLPPTNNNPGNNQQVQNDAGLRCDTLAAWEYDPARPSTVPGVSAATLKRHLADAETACRQAVQAYPNESRYYFQLGHVYETAGQDGEAVTWFRQAADRGSAQGMTDLGVMYQLGRGVAQSYTEAKSWYDRGAAGGASDAMANLGNLYDAGLGVTEDMVESGRWFERGAALGNADAIAAIGYRYDNGRGVTLDYAEARSWYEKAALKGSGYAMNNLAYLFDWGLGGSQDFTLARYWYGKAAELGQDTAMNNLGYAYEHGRGVTQDYAQAAAWYQRGADAGNEFAMTNLANMYYGGIGMAADYPRAFALYQKAADLGSAEAMTNLGNMYDNGHGVAQDVALAKQWYEAAAATGYGDAIHNLGYVYEVGRGVSPNVQLASQYYVQALSIRNPATIAEFRDHPDSYSLEARRAIQQFLIDRGYLDGSADGVIGDRARNALTAWQNAQ